MTLKMFCDLSSHNQNSHDLQGFCVMHFMDGPNKKFQQKFPFDEN